jgi:uncharacterized membrane protein (UPF0127 family)
MNPRLFYSALIAFIMIGLSIGISVSKKSCDETYRQDKIISVNKHMIIVQVAKSDYQRQQGLADKSCLQAGHGMLFQFEKTGNYPFWMKDMKFPIDIIWINSAHEAVSIQADATPSSYPKTYVNQDPAIDVLEIPAGQAASLGIQTGTKFSY